MAAGLPQAAPPDMGGIDAVIVPTLVQVAPIVLYEGADQAAFGMPDNESGTNLVIDALQAQLAA